MIRQISVVTTFLFALNTWADSKVKCSFTFEPIQGHQLIGSVNIRPDVTIASATDKFGFSGETVFDDVDFDYAAYVKQVMVKYGLTDGLFWKIRRDDTQGIRIFAIVGKIEKSEIIDIQESLMDFTLTNEEKLGSLTCKAE